MFGLRPRHFRFRFRSTLVAAGAACALMPSLALAQAQQPSHTRTPASHKTHGTSTHVTLQKIDPAAGMADQEDLVGQQAFDFSLVDTQGKTHTLSEYVNQGKIVVLEWFNPTCPFSRFHHVRKSTMTDIYAKYADKDVVWLAINSGEEDSTNSPAINEETRKKWKVTYPILLDPTGKVGKAYGAKNTPTMYVIGAAGTIAYVGAIDNKRAPDEPAYVDSALKSLTAGSVVQTSYAKPYGCSVKYKN